MTCDDNNCSNSTDNNPVQMKSCNIHACTDSGLQPQCLNGLSYFDCGPCEASCSSNEYCDKCGPVGCYCPAGLVFSSFLNKTNCVPQKECGCSFEDKYVPSGSEVLISNCEVCICNEGKLSHCKIKSNCHHDDVAICSWSSWGSWGPCFGPCGVNGIQWSFRSPAVPSVYGIEERCQGASKKSRRCRTSQCSFCHDEQGVTRMVGAQWRNGCTVCRCTKSGQVQCNKFCEYQLISNGCPPNTTLFNPEDQCCYCSDHDEYSGDTTLSPYTPQTDIPMVCSLTEAKCLDQSGCIPYENQCDGITDCTDGSDERYCLECLMTKWTNWSECSQTCGIGVRVKTRAVSIDNVIIDNCANLEFESVQPCQISACPINGYFTPWSQWLSCDQPCDGGLKKRNRQCHEPKNNGSPCTGKFIEVLSCNENPCLPNEGCQGNKTLITDSCDSLCPSTCAELSHETDCVKKCSNKNKEITGCFCSNNMLLQDGICVPSSKCRCLYHGQELTPGTHIIDNCRCNCINGILECTDCATTCQWSAWSSWSLCFTKNNDCDQTGVQHRFRSPTNDIPCKVQVGKLNKRCLNTNGLGT